MGNSSHDRKIAKCLQAVTDQNLYAAAGLERRVFNDTRYQCRRSPIFCGINNKVVAISMGAG